MSDPLHSLAAEVVAGLAAAGRSVATAESCTGGWIAKSLTDVAGSSTVFGFGFVTYSNEAKRALLGVSGDTLAAHGAVSEAVVTQMARGALDLSGADTAVAVSGIAGPGGATPGKPVGTVWFAWAIRTGAEIAVATDRQRFDGDRDAIRRLSVAHALERIRDTLS
jgi:nicotinamide-nucleotide amidase